MADCGHKPCSVVGGDVGADASGAAAQVPFATNVTCNRTCVFELEENAFFNLEDSVITRGRSTYIANDPELAQVRPIMPVASLLGCT